MIGRPRGKRSVRVECGVEHGLAFGDAESGSCDAEVTQQQRNVSGCLAVSRSACSVSWPGVTTLAP